MKLKPSQTRKKAEKLLNSVFDKQREVSKQVFVELGISIEEGIDLLIGSFEEVKKQFEVLADRKEVLAGKSVEQKNEGILQKARNKLTACFTLSKYAVFLSVSEFAVSCV